MEKTIEILLIIAIVVFLWATRKKYMPIEEDSLDLEDPKDFH